ncbi:MAG: KH domain-containing protein [Candidatus Paceibacterota bacterium]
MAEVKDQDFLEYIVKTLVDHPNDVIVNRDVDEMGVLLTVKVNPEDMGQLIGRQGSTARAIRSLVKIIGLKNHARVNLKIEEPEGSTKVKEEKKEEKIDDVTDGLDDLKI